MFFSGWGKLRSGSSLDQLSAAEKKSKVGRLNDWWSNTLQPTNMSLCLQCGTFHFRRRLKPISMPFVLRARRLNIPKTDRSACLAAKKAIHIQASGGVYSEGPAASFESGHSYLKKIMHFHGVPSFEGIFLWKVWRPCPTKPNRLKRTPFQKQKTPRNDSRTLWLLQ